MVGCLQYELVAELFTDRQGASGPTPEPRKAVKGGVLRAAKEGTKAGLKSHKKTVGSQVLFL